MELRQLKVKGDSHLVIKKLNKENKMTNPTILTCLQEVRKLEPSFRGISFEYMPMWENFHTNTLVQQASSYELRAKSMFVDKLTSPLAMVPET
jgi:hypothetical protein